MGCPILDGMMGGGIQCGLITELVGAQWLGFHLTFAIINFEGLRVVSLAFSPQVRLQQGRRRHACSCC